MRFAVPFSFALLLTLTAPVLADDAGASPSPSASQAATSAPEASSSPASTSSPTATPSPAATASPAPASTPGGPFPGIHIPPRPSSAPLMLPVSSELTVSDVIAADPITGNPPLAFLWSPHGKRYVYRVPAEIDGAPSTVRVVDLATGRDRELLTARSSALGTRSRPIEQIAWAGDENRVAIVDAGTLEVVDVRNGRVTKIGPDADDPQFSPDGSEVAFVRDGDLYAASVDGSAPVRTRRLTSSGSASVLNGDPDWLYSEELDVEHGYKWSPDSDSIAFLQFDDSPVTPFPIQDYRHLVNTVEQQRYPLAGAANPHVSLRVVSVEGAPAAPLVLFDGARHDDYPLSFVWTPDGSAVVDEVLDRAQHHLRYIRFERGGGASRLVSRENDSRFVDVQPAPVFVRNGDSMLVLSERGGVQGLDRVDLKGGATHRLTGSTPIAAIQGVDERRGVVYVTALAPTRRDRSLLAVAIDGSRTTNLTSSSGTHETSVPEDGGPAFIDSASSFSEPPTIVRRSIAGGAGATLFTTPSLDRRGIAKTHYVSIPSPDGPLDASLTVPADFDPAHRYPVRVTIYGGPLPVGDHFADRWQGLDSTLLAQRGVLTLNIDVPAERDDRASYERSYAGAMGTVAIEGPLAAAKWLGTQPYVDASRLGLYGWSYGGYLTAFTMTHSHLFRSGAAGAPPTDWRMYDSAYTERYLGTPQKHGDAYHRTSIVASAADLSGQLLIIHGSSDDNVHLTNSLAFIAACIAAGKPVESFVFPGARHGPAGVPANRFLETMLLDWWSRTLLR